MSAPRSSSSTSFPEQLSILSPHNFHPVGEPTSKMTVFTFLAWFLLYFCNTVFCYYIQTKRFDYDPSSMLMYNQMYSRNHWIPYHYETDRPVDENVIPNWESLGDGGTIDKRVTADQINSLLKNAWLGR